MLIAFTSLPGLVTMVFRGMPTVWRGRHRLIFCWLIFMQAVSPGRKTLEEMARWTPATITAWRFGRLLKAAYWNLHLIVKIPAASGGALEGRSLSCWGNLSPKPPNMDAIPPHRKQWGILASFRGKKHWFCMIPHGALTCLLVESKVTVPLLVPSHSSFFKRVPRAAII